MIVLTALCGLSLALMEFQNRRQQEEREAWQKERKDLMDRIQAPTFAAYTGKVIAEKKAEQPPKEEDKIEFVS